MTKTTTAPPATPDRHATDRRRRPGLGAWLGIGIPILFLIGLVTADLATDTGGGGELVSVPDFHLVRTDGSPVDRAWALADGPALFYFSMGPGCGTCFTQIPELDAGLAQRGIRLVPVMVDPPEMVARQASLFGVDQPIVIDADRTLSKAMGMLGVYGHVDRPSHSFALADAEGSIVWVRHYAEMFVPAADFFAELDRA